jgi:hypothetical protein
MLIVRMLLVAITDQRLKRAPEASVVGAGCAICYVTTLADIISQMSSLLDLA